MSTSKKEDRQVSNN